MCVIVGERELLAIQKYRACYPVVGVEEIYGNLHKARQKLIVPVKETTEEFVHNWEAVRYEGKGFRTDVPEFYTAKGERVRSKSEVIIADALYRKGIPYRYEYPLHLSGVGEIYPDFMVLNVRLRKEMYWEHFGRMDDLDYVEKTMRKLAGYMQNELFPGDRMIYTYETRRCPINQKQICGIIQHYLL